MESLKAMTEEAKRKLYKRLLELAVAAITAWIAAITTSCAVRWSSNSVEMLPRGVWSYHSMTTNTPNAD